jgi:hypothetical protein
MRLTPSHRRGATSLIVAVPEPAIRRDVHPGDTGFDLGTNIGL